MTTSTRLRRTAIVVVTLLAALALWAAPASAVAPPKVMVALGDSITRAFNSDGPGCPTGPSLDCAKNSWSTGTNPAVNSQFQRIEAIDPGRNPIAINDAVSGARAGTDRTTTSGDPIDLVPQAQKAATQNPDYVTIEIGANDACRQTISDQTPTDTFSNHVETALNTLVTADPKVYIELLSIPDINQLYTIFTSPGADPNAVLRWSPLVFNVCQALLANAPSDAPADVARRAAFRQQVIAYNGALAEVCAEFKRCLFDNYAVFNSTFTAADVATVTNTGGLNIPPFNAIPIIPVPGAIPNSTADYFHPSLLGQASLAETSWNATFPMN
jgi:lysophospholipase L1-like esterase